MHPNVAYFTLNLGNCSQEALNRGLLPDDSTLRQLALEKDSIVYGRSLESMQWPDTELRTVLIRRFPCVHMSCCYQQPHMPCQMSQPPWQKHLPLRDDKGFVAFGEAEQIDCIPFGPADTIHILPHV